MPSLSKQGYEYPVHSQKGGEETLMYPTNCGVFSLHTGKASGPDNSVLDNRETTAGPGLLLIS